MSSPHGESCSDVWGGSTSPGRTDGAHVHQAPAHRQLARVPSPPPEDDEAGEPDCLSLTRDNMAGAESSLGGVKLAPAPPLDQN